jgi:peptidoglycan/LPS O-acetylase OafA/YrhL
VSYATYIIHGVLHVTFREHIDSVPLRAAALVSVSLGLAALSWRYFEAPILGLKRRWPMPRADRGRMAGP